MGDLNRRLRRLEQEANLASDRCPECGGKIIFEEEMADGSTRYPNGPPCPECGSSGSGGQVGTIVVSTLDPDNPPGDVYQLEHDE